MHAEVVVEVCIQLLTVLALCAFAVAAGVIVGSMLGRSTVTPGMVLLSVSSFDNLSPPELILPDPKNPTNTNTTAVLRAQFVVTAPVHNKGEPL